MEDYDVNINVPPPEKKEDTIIVTGPVKNVERAIEALKARNDTIEAENEERKLQRFEMILNVPNKHHPKLIGRSLFLFLFCVKGISNQIFLEVKTSLIILIAVLKEV